MTNIQKKLKRIALLLFFILLPQQFYASIALQQKTKEEKPKNNSKVLYIAGGCGIVFISAIGLYKLLQPSTENSERNPLQKPGRQDESTQQLFKNVKEKEDRERVKYKSNTAILNQVESLLQSRPLSGLQQLGKGGCGTVYELGHYALKISKDNKKQNLQHELAKIQHLGEGMVKAYGIVTKNNQHFLVLEKIFQKTEEEWENMNDKEVLVYALQALKTIKRWKEQGKKHGDVKHDNIGFRKNDSHDKDEFVFIDPLPEKKSAIGGYRGGSDEKNAMRSLVNLRFSLKRKKSLSTILTTIKEGIIRSICNGIKQQDIIEYLNNVPLGKIICSIYKPSNEQEYRSALQELLYKEFITQAHNNFSRYIPDAYNCIIDEKPIPTTHTLKEKIIPQVAIVYASLGLSMQVKNFERIKELNEREVMNICNDNFKEKLEKADYDDDELEELKKIHNKPIRLAVLKMFIAHIQTLDELDQKHPSSDENYFSSKTALYEIIYDNLVEEYPNFRSMVNIIRERTTVQRAIEEISQTIQNL